MSDDLSPEMKALSLISMPARTLCDPRKMSREQWGSKAGSIPQGIKRQLQCARR
jgi:hypothetical protein